MKIRHKKLIASGIALSLAGVLGAGALLQTSVSVQASYAMMPGIEQIVKDTSEEKPFKILEIVDDTNEAEIGYYVSGQEPYVKLYEYKYTDSDGQEQTMKFQSLEEGLSKLPTPELRKEFAMNVKLDANGNTGIKQIQDVCYQDGSSAGESKDYPLSYSNYQEKYFLTQEEKDSNAWKEIKQFINPTTNEPTTYTKKIKGNYQENPAGTGDYTKKEQQYYPIREKANNTDAGDADNPNAKYRENIQNFYYADSDGANAPYFLEFSEVENTTVNNALTNSSGQGKETILSEYNYENGRYGYYENVYSDLTTEIANNISNKNYTFPGESPASPDGKKLLIQDNTSAANAFSAGSDEFTFLDEGNGTEQSSVEDNTTGQNQPDVAESEPEIDSGVADAGFSDGEFSSEELNAGESDLDSTDSNNQNGNETSNPEEETVTDNEATKQTDNNGANSIKTPLITYAPSSGENTGSDTTIDKTNTSEDPLVYYGITIDQYPFYQYKLISDLNTIKAKAINVDKNQDPSFNLEQKLGENPISINNGNQCCNITIQDGQYWFWVWNVEDTVSSAVKYPISIVTQRQPVAYSDIRQLPEDLGYNYYYKVERVYFCCKKDEAAAAEDPHAYKYYGWYSPSYADENNPYIPVKDGEIPTHYISDAEYELTPGTGNYDFVPDDNAPEQTVEVDHLYYQGGYTNHDWFKQYVFHLEPGEAGSDERKQFDAFKIEVTTITTQKFNEQYGSADETASAASGDSDATEITGDGDSTGSDHSSADDSVNSDDAQADNSQTDDIQSGEVQTDNTSDDQNTDTQDANETQTEAPATAQNEGDTSEVDPMVSEAGVELVSIEKEFSDSTDNEDDQENSFQDGTENEVMPEAESSSDESFSAGDTDSDSDSGKTKLEDYDLIYLNGTGLNESSYQKILDIVSPQKSKKKPCIINQTKLQNNVTFKSSFESIINDNDRDGHYVNCNVYFFKNNFLPDDQDNGSLLNVSFDKNFNLAYTEEPDSFSDGNSLMEGFEEILKYIEKENKYRKIKENSTNKDNTENQEENTLLSTKISQARVIEYIINYRLKRNDLPTGKIRVLELQPARSQGEITDSQVLRWLGHGMTVQSCCNHNGEPAENVLNDETSIWHSAYDAGDTNNNHEGNHYLKISFTNPENIDGFIYRARPEGQNGAIYKYTLELYDENNSKIGSIQGNFDIQTIDRNSATIKFENTYSNVKSMKLIFDSTFGDNDSLVDKFASARKFLPIFHDVEITTMTTSEFVGHIDDLNTKYDMIYLGDDAEDLDYSGNFRPDEQVLYYHVGGYKLALYELQGLMNHDYVTNGSQRKAATVGETDSTTNTTIGSVRGSGNDITKEIKNKLVNFAKSGYPVVVAGDIYSKNKETISTKLVDNSSYIYDFLNEVKGFDNVYREGEITADEDINFYAELPKPKIELSSSPPSAIGTGDGPSDKFLAGENMTFQFQIIDEAQASPANAEYNCELYIDLNCDGNFSNTEKLEDIAVMQNGNVIQPDNDGTYHLSLNTDYTVSRKIPQEYIKLMPWKLVVTNNNNSEIRTSKIGYTKRQNTNSTANTIKVLQIIPNPSTDPNAQCTWNLATDTTFRSLFEKVKDFDVQISTITVGNYETQHSTDATYLNQYNMLIIGFCDGAGYGSSYGGNNPTNFSAEGAQRILEFANTGKSVILAHDNTSSSVYDRTAQDGDGIWYGWAYYFNQILRAASGMDRYGITAPQSTSNILKQAKELDAHEQSTDWNTVFKNSSDMAYFLNKNKEKTYSETQGFTNGKLRIAVTDRGSETVTETTTTASQVNEGAITEYPYKIDKKITVAETHFQYYQLALEENADEDDSGDLVVWYCLGDKDNKTGNGYYDHSPNDVRNNYYIYSYKNIIYTGVGHKPVTNNGNLMEKKLFVNTIIAAYNAQAVNPELMFVKQSDRNAAQEKTVYYTLDNVNFNESQELIKNKPLEFHLKVTDSNLVGTSFAGTNTKDLKLQLYIESDDGTKIEGIGGENTKVKEIHLPVYKAGERQAEYEDGYVYVNSGNVYDFTLNELQNYESYLKTSAGYKGKVTLYAKISCKYIYYGTEKEAQSVAQINICQRQLFDLD